MRKLERMTRQRKSWNRSLRWVTGALAVAVLAPNGARAEAGFASTLEVALELRDLSLLSSSRLGITYPERWTEFDADPPGSISDIEGETEVSVNFTPGGIVLSTILNLRVAASGYASWDGGPDRTEIAGVARASGSFALVNNTPDPLDVPFRVTAGFSVAGSVDLDTSEFASTILALSFGGSRGIGLPEGNILYAALLPPMESLYDATRPDGGYEYHGSLALLGRPVDYTMTLPGFTSVGEFNFYTVGLLAEAGGLAASRLRSDGTSAPLLFEPEPPPVDAVPVLEPVLPPGDLNADADVGRADLKIVLDGLKSRRGEPDYCTACDFDLDGIVGPRDVRAWISYFLQFLSERQPHHGAAHGTR